MRSQLPKLYYEIAYICSWQRKKDRIQYLTSFYTKVGLKKKHKKDNKMNRVHKEIHSPNTGKIQYKMAEKCKKDKIKIENS